MSYSDTPSPGQHEDSTTAKHKKARTASKKYLSNEKFDNILSWLEHSPNYDSVNGISGKTLIGKPLKTATQGFNEMATFVNKRSKGLSGRQMKERFGRYKKSYTTVRPVVNGTGFGITDEKETIGVDDDTMEDERDDYAFEYEYRAEGSNKEGQEDDDFDADDDQGDIDNAQLEDDSMISIPITTATQAADTTSTLQRKRQSSQTGSATKRSKDQRKAPPGLKGELPSKNSLNKQRWDIELKKLQLQKHLEELEMRSINMREKMMTAWLVQTALSCGYSVDDVAKLISLLSKSEDKEDQ